MEIRLADIEIIARLPVEERVNALKEFREKLLAQKQNELVVSALELVEELLVQAVEEARKIREVVSALSDVRTVESKDVARQSKTDETSLAQKLTAKDSEKKDLEDALEKEAGARRAQASEQKQYKTGTENSPGDSLTQVYERIVGQYEKILRGEEGGGVGYERAEKNIYERKPGVEEEKTDREKSLRIHDEKTDLKYRR